MDCADANPQPDVALPTCRPQRELREGRGDHTGGWVRGAVPQQQHPQGDGGEAARTGNGDSGEATWKLVSGHQAQPFVSCVAGAGLAAEAVVG